MPDKRTTDGVLGRTLGDIPWLPAPGRLRKTPGASLSFSHPFRAICAYLLGHRRCRPYSAHSGAAGEKNYGRLFTVASHSTNIGCCFRPSDVWRYRLEVELCSGQPKIFYEFSILITRRMANSALSHVFNNIFSSRDLVISCGTIRPPRCQDIESEKCCDSR